MTVPVDKTHPEAGFVEFEPLILPAVDLVWLVIGGVCAAVLWAGWVVFAVLNALLGNISIFGFHPFRLVFGLLESVMKSLASGLDSRITHLAEVLWSVVLMIWRPLWVIADTLWTLTYRIGDNFVLGQHNLTNEQNRALQAEGTIQTNLNSEIADLGLALTTLEAAMSTVVNDTLPTLQAEINLEESRINTLEGQGSGVTATELQQLQNLLEQQLSQNATNLGAGIQHAEDLATQEDTQLSARLQGQIANSLTTAETFATGAAAGAEAGAVAQTLAQLQPQIDKIATDITECLDPLCADVSPTANQLGNLGRLLQALEGLFGAAALTGLLVAAVEDPKGTAGVVVGTAGWMGSLGEEMAKGIGDLAGVQL